MTTATAAHPDTPDVTPEMVAEHGLTPEEYERILAALGRTPNLTELGIYSVMWSEHCSYKSSKVHLKKLPTAAPWVIQGPGENAGVIDIGDGQAAVFKMESHNHPSYIEPYQGAATGVGGILRDVFTMGARPVANMNALRFGDPDHPKTRHLVSGVVAGIGGYGNCVGVPTVGGETDFDASYNGNILVNAMTVGLAEADRIFYSAAAGVGNPVVYVGSKTGRDGIHGATMASAEFDEDSEEKRPTVQVGDPFTEKLLLEACLELMGEDAIIAIQDMGAAGLTSSSVEMADKGGVGIALDLDAVPCREQAMTAYEMMLSESQERMLMVLQPGREELARGIFEKWDLDFAIIGRLTESGRMVLRWHGDVVGDLPIDPLAEASPEYDRPHSSHAPLAPLSAGEVPDVEDLGATLAKLLGAPDLCSRRWVWEQYDHMVMADTLGSGRPGGDAALVRVHGTRRGIAASTDCTPRYCLADPVEGGKQAVAEGYRNLSASGATPLAVTNNLNFGNPEKPEIMAQLVGAVQGMGEACRALETPVVSGNVSLYNETDGRAINPTPVIGSVGLVEDVAKAVGIAFAAEGETLLLIGGGEASEGHLGQSIYLRDILGRAEGSPPTVDLVAEKRTGGFVRNHIAGGGITACHDISDGGLLVALAEMALAGRMGCALEFSTLPSHWAAWAFGEGQGRYLATSAEPDAVMAAADKAGVRCLALGRTGGDSLKVADWAPISLSGLREAHEGWMPRYMAATA